MSGEVQKSPDHQQRAAKESAPFEAGKAALFSEAVKLLESGQGKQKDDEQKNAVCNQRVAGEHGGKNDRPENHRGDQPAEKNICLRRRLGWRSRVGHCAEISTRAGDCQLSIAGKPISVARRDYFWQFYVRPRMAGVLAQLVERLVRNKIWAFGPKTPHPVALTKPAFLLGFSYFDKTPPGP